MNLKLGLSVGALAAIVSLVVVLVVGGAGQRGQDGKDGRDGQIVGSVPVLESPICVAGVCYHYKAQPVRSATTTVCSFRTPNGTTTGQVSVKLRSSPTYVGYQMAADVLTNTGTTTSLGQFADGDGISTADAIFAPNTYINVKLSSTTGVSVGAEFNPTGDCFLELRQMDRAAI